MGSYGTVWSQWCEPTSLEERVLSKLYGRSVESRLKRGQMEKRGGHCIDPGENGVWDQGGSQEMVGVIGFQACFEGRTNRSCDGPNVSRVRVLF